MQDYLCETGQHTGWSKKKAACRVTNKWH